MIIGILTKNGEGLREKHRESLTIQLIRGAYNNLVEFEKALDHCKRSKLAVAYIKGDEMAEELVW